MGVIYDVAKRLIVPTDSKTYRTRPAATPEAAAVVLSNDRGKQGKNNSVLYRNWAQNGEWVRAAINIRRDQVASAEWDIVPYNADLPWDKVLAAEIRDLFTSPNPLAQSWRGFIGPIVEDLLVLDAGVKIGRAHV